MSEAFEAVFPLPKEGDNWISILKWLVAVMDDDDRQLEFIASVLTHGLKYGRLTPKQEYSCGRVLDRIVTSYEHGKLKLLGWTESAEQQGGLRLVKPVGGAS